MCRGLVTLVFAGLGGKVEWQDEDDVDEVNVFVFCCCYELLKGRLILFVSLFCKRMCVLCCCVCV